MVKTRFPGKPSKAFNRRRVSGVNSDDSDSIKAIKNAILSVSYFSYLFNGNEEDNNSFHGFSPHEVDVSQSSFENLASAGNKKISKTQSSRTSGPTRPLKLLSKSNPGSSTDINTASDLPTSCNAATSQETCRDEPEELVAPHKFNPVDDSSYNSKLSRTFVLPSRSAHSSRVIKPNKRFLQANEVPVKKNRSGNSSDLSDVCEFSETSSEGSLNVSQCFSDKKGKNKKSVDNPSSVKFVLRKPRLKIKSQPLPSVGGPFSSPAGSSLSLQGGNSQSPSVKKVFCGICGSLRTFKFFQHAKKFGIFSCLPCRKFILRIIKSERNNTLKALTCTSGLGICPIRQNSLAAQCFPNDSQEKAGDERERCEACWLNLCLRSFQIPLKLVKRLNSFLPLTLQKSAALFRNTPHDGKLLGSKIENKGAGDSDVPYTSSETRILKRTKGVRESINIRRGSTYPALRLSSHRGRGLRENEDIRRGRGQQQKLPVAGPRVKHVCRSASLVLGQPVATFNEGNSSQGFSSEEAGEDIHPESEKNACGIKEVVLHSQVYDQERSYPDVALDKARLPEKDFDYPPIARMLQDLGRANCELLDGMENHELEKLNARVSIDFWESYDPEEVSQMGFPLIGFSPMRLRSLCFLCGSAGLEKLIHCCNCCEPYHPFCVSNKLNPEPKEDWWRLDWLCPKCTYCEACLRTGGQQLSCAKCQKSYHSSCISTSRINIYDHNWVCPDCLFCKSCNDSSVHVFVGNMPLCKSCFKLRKKGNYCPLCQCCYDENDYVTKMMECAECKCWIHAQCEGISNEKYQVLSYLPPSVEFVCRLCNKIPPAPWCLAVEAELKAGYLNVIKILSKNKSACAMFKASPKKQKVCVCNDLHRNPIHLSTSESDSYGIDSPSESSPDREYKSTDLGLLTPKLTKDDEESLKTVKSDFLSLVKKRDVAEELSPKKEDVSIDKNNQLLTIAYDKLRGENSDEFSLSTTINKDTLDSKENGMAYQADKTCNCHKFDSNTIPPLSLLTVKHKASNDEYRTVIDFHSDMEKVVLGIGNSELAETYNRCLKQIFPWFDPSLDDSILDPLPTGNDSDSLKKLVESPRKNSDTKSKHENHLALKGLLNLEQSSYYIGMDFIDSRSCLLCKKTGEGFPRREGRLLYCGQNEWVHINCALWSSEVFEEIDGSLQNVQSAVSRARLIRCTQCGKKGASLGCCAKSCPSAYHFGCAFSAECVFLESKEVFCKAHESHKADKEIHKEEDFFIKRSVYVELDHKKVKEVLRSVVNVYIGSLEVDHIGEIIPDLSDSDGVILPCEFSCSRLYWSCKEPWKIVRYNIKTKLTNINDDFSYDNDTNYTVDHSLEFTPPPSPIDSIMGDRFSVDAGEKDIKAMVNRIIETICVKEEEGNLSDQQGTDLLPPELTDEIYDDLPKDFLDRITVNDIFTKMSFDDILIDKNEPTESHQSSELFCDKLNSKVKTKGNKLFVNVVKPKSIEKRKSVFEVERSTAKQWKRPSILQVDGAVDLSESDLSNDSCDVQMHTEDEDEPVKCGRCRRTYRTKQSYERHLSTCSSDYLSLSESDLSEEEKTQGLPEDAIVKCESNSTTDSSEVEEEAVHDPQVQLFSIPVEMKSVSVNEQRVQLMQNSFENSVICVNNTDMNSYSESTESIVNVNFTTTNETLSTSNFPTEQALVSTVDTIVSDQMVGLQQQTLILQQMPNESVPAPSFIQSSFHEPQPPNIQYITAINTLEKTQFLTSNSIGSTYHIPQQISQQIIPSVSTVLGTIVQSNGVEQIVLNNPNPNIDIYNQQQSNMIIANSPMIVGMETVVRNSVMQSSRFITGAPGVLTSHSATTTQVIQATKPVLDIPQSFVVINPNLPSIVENNTVQSCMQSVVQTASLPNQEWNSYKVNYINEVKPSKEISYPKSMQEMVPLKQVFNGMKVVNPVPIRKEDKPMIKNLVKPQFNPAISDRCYTPTPPPPCNYNVTCKPVNHVKAVELPSSSAVHKEKPQQAVAPVVIKNISPPPPLRKSPEPPPLLQNGISHREMDGKKSLFLPVENATRAISTLAHEPTIAFPPMSSKESCSKTVKAPVDAPSSESKQIPTTNLKKEVLISNVQQQTSLKRPREETGFKLNGIENPKRRKIIQEEPKICFEISSEDGFYFNTTNVEEAWIKVYETVQNARKAKNLPQLSENPFSSPDIMLKKLMGLGNNSMKYLLEQLPGISSCSKYKPIYHKKPPSALEKELYQGRRINPSGSARSEQFKHCRKTYDMFSWLASRHRRPPKLLPPETDGLNGNSRRATSLNLPMAMRFRHLKETSKHSVGVFRSDIHGRGLFCLRDIDSGEMVIEYAGEVIRSALTDKRERYYTEKGIGCYMFRIDDKFVVDATMKGNAARFINHSCEPNCYSRVIDILGKKHILIFALRKILQGEELTYDYKFPLEEDKINCHCLSRKCRKYLN